MTCDCRAEVLVEPRGTIEVVLGQIVHEVEITPVVHEVEITPVVHEVEVRTTSVIVVEVSTVPPSVEWVPRVRQPLLGDIDGSNTVFTSPYKFVHDAVRPETLYYNGVAQDEGISDDYIASESGGVGTGFDTIIMSFPPRVGDKLWLTFYHV